MELIASVVRAVLGVDASIASLIAWTLVLATAIVVALGIGRSFKGRSGKGKAVLLLGPMGAGKTALFFRLQQHTFRDTYTSMKENEGAFRIQGKQAHVIDVPGHGSQQSRLSGFLADARAVIFLVDSTAASFKEAGELLFGVLMNTDILKRRVPIFIACSKADAQGAKTTAEVEQALLGTINNKRKLSHTMAELESSATQQHTLGKANTDFQFSQYPSQISLGSLSVKTDNTASVLAFLESAL